MSPLSLIEFRVKELEELEKKATPGPLFVHESNTTISIWATTRTRFNRGMSVCHFNKSTAAKVRDSTIRSQLQANEAACKISI